MLHGTILLVISSPNYPYNLLRLTSYLFCQACLQQKDNVRCFCCSFRAPTADQGLAPACKDTFAGEVRLRVWKRGAAASSADAPYIDATSRSAALEVSSV